MKQDIFFNIGQTVVIGVCALVVVIITSIIHHCVGKITRWWNPKWASFLFSAITGGVAQFLFVEVLEPFLVLIIMANIVLIYLSAVGFNAAVGKPVELFTDFETEETRGMKGKASIPAFRETWRTRWFE